MKCSLRLHHFEDAAFFSKKIKETGVMEMAKDGTNRGGARPGAGRKPKALTEKISEGNAAAVLMEPATLEGAEVPPVKDFLKSPQKSGRELVAEEVYHETFLWLKARGCEKLVTVQMVEQYAMSVSRWIQCEEIVSRLPGGYYSNIGENCCALSGGERQRISIARAILKDAPVVILDEATASMDAENENLVQQALSVLLQGKTVLVIAHRMRTIANVDKVVVLEQGRVAETGTPEELLNQKGLFYRLAEAQTVHR